MPWSVAILAVSLFAFIVTMMGTLAAYFGKRWKSFLILLFLLLVSTGAVSIQLYQMIVPPAPRDLPLLTRQGLPPL